MNKCLVIPEVIRVPASEVDLPIWAKCPCGMTMPDSSKAASIKMAGQPIGGEKGETVAMHGCRSDIELEDGHR